MTRRDPTCTLKVFGRLRKVLDFIPGSYNFELSGTLQPINPSVATAVGLSSPPRPEPRVFSESATLKVGIEQSDILLFSALGGLLAYVLMDIRQAQGSDINSFLVAGFPNERVSKLLVLVKNSTGAAFLSAATTIVASRLSGTEFPVKVSVNDFWGALTVGFVSYFVGGKFIDKLAGLKTTP